MLLAAPKVTEANAIPVILSIPYPLDSQLRSYNSSGICVHFSVHHTCEAKQFDVNKEKDQGRGIKKTTQNILTLISSLR